MNTKDLINSLVHAIANYPDDNFYRANARCARDSSLRWLLAGDDAKAREMAHQGFKELSEPDNSSISQLLSELSINPKKKGIIKQTFGSY
tara:strand:- start:18 stop:287 length:270 start_codon:yes stop_codon:yes gene_type:complete